ncbi:hypothetical protein [Bradyrhizobium sp. McL0616]|uniref:hypothetical protein n=1 Tax=Bradyrhizobium sp. McL0616 TaxID=3415674 RepID=UPI003CF71EAA
MNIPWIIGILAAIAFFAVFESWPSAIRIGSTRSRAPVCRNFGSTSVLALGR